MSTKNLTRDKYPGATQDALTALDRPYTLGIDAEGAVHHHSPYDDRVVVVTESGAIERTIEIGDRRLAASVAFLDDERGWSTLNHAESFGDILREAL